MVDMNEDSDVREDFEDKPSSEGAMSCPPPITLEDGMLSCPQCPKVFNNMKLMQQHQQMFHTDKSFICEICNKAFRFRSNLAEHRSVHTALKPYVCTYCGKSSRLKGNLTKHILKHHKKEHSEAVGKDEIIVHKGTTASSEPTLSLLPKEEANDQERSILISLGLDYNSSLDLRESPEPSASPENESIAKSDFYMESEQSFDGTLPNTVGGETSLAALIASVSTPPPSSTSNGQTNGGGSSNGLSNSASTQQQLNAFASTLLSAAASLNGANAALSGAATAGSGTTGGGKGTQCVHCGKHFRKSAGLQTHMTVCHGFQPQESATCSEVDKNSECGANSPAEDFGMNNVQAELRQMRMAMADMKPVPLGPKIEQLLSGMDTRVGRLEKQVEMALNSIYTLVQLQTGMNSSINRFKDDVAEQLRTIRTMLNEERTDA